MPCALHALRSAACCVQASSLCVHLGDLGALDITRPCESEILYAGEDAGGLHRVGKHVEGGCMHAGEVIQASHHLASVW